MLIDFNLFKKKKNEFGGRSEKFRLEWKGWEVVKTIRKWILKSFLKNQK